MTCNESPSPDEFHTLEDEMKGIRNETENPNDPVKFVPAVKLFFIQHLSNEEQMFFEEIREDLMRCKYLRQQVVMVVDCLRPTSKVINVTWESIGKIFARSKGAVRDMYQKGEPIEKEVGRPPILDDGQWEVVREFIYERYKAGYAALYSEILDFIEMRFDINMKMDTLRKMINRIPGVKVGLAQPMDAKRLECPPEKIDESFNILEDLFKKGWIPTAFVINFDESGFSEWQDRTPLYVVIPEDAPQDQIYLPVDRSGRRSTLLAAIAADGSALPPAIIVKRKSIEAELYELGYTPDKLLIFEQENGFITAKIFLQWAQNVLIPYVHRRRQMFNYWGPALFIMDGCSSHFSQEFTDLCNANYIWVHILPAHSSDQTQPLDIGIFGPQKRKMHHLHLHGTYNTQTQQIIKICNSWHTITTVSNIIGAFRGAGIVGKWVPEKHMNMPFIDRSCATKVRHWVTTGEEYKNTKRIPLPTPRPLHINW